MISPAEAIATKPPTTTTKNNSFKHSNTNNKIDTIINLSFVFFRNKREEAH